MDSDVRYSTKLLLRRFIVLGNLAAILYASPFACAADEKTPLILSSKGGIKVESADGQFAARLGGRLQVDYAYYDSDLIPLGSGAEIRRARLLFEGRLWRDWVFKFNPDFAGNEVSIQDAWLGYAGFSPFFINVGNIKEPFSIQSLTSDLDIEFLERSLPVEIFQPGYNLGLQTHGYGDGPLGAYQGAIGLFGQGIDNPGTGESQSYGTVARATFAPLSAEGRVLHFGSAFEWRTDYRNDEVLFRGRPESHVTDVRLVDTGDIGNADSTLKFNAESAVVWGPWSVQGEYIQTNVNRNNGGEGLSFNGWYVFGSWFLTGESRAYDAKGGKFSRVKPKSVVGSGGYGAWEVVVRGSSVDLNSKEINGGKETDLTVGINWYTTPKTRLMFNYIYVDANVIDPDTGLEVKDNPNIFTVRAQVDF